MFRPFPLFIGLRYVRARRRTRFISVVSAVALLGLAIDRAANRVTIVAAVDNLAKGTAGAAVQSMNVHLGVDEGLGL